MTFHSYQGNNHLRDRLAAATIELEQKENDLEVRNEELTGYLNELDQRTQEVEDWKTEVREERARVEELQDVSFFSLRPSHILFLTSNFRES